MATDSPQTALPSPAAATPTESASTGSFPSKAPSRPGKAFGSSTRSPSPEGWRRFLIPAAVGASFWRGGARPHGEPDADGGPHAHAAVLDVGGVADVGGGEQAHPPARELRSARQRGHVRFEVRAPVAGGDLRVDDPRAVTDATADDRGRSDAPGRGEAPHEVGEAATQLVALEHPTRGRIDHAGRRVQAAGAVNG